MSIHCNKSNFNVRVLVKIGIFARCKFLSKTLSMNHMFTHVHLFQHGICGDEKDKTSYTSPSQMPCFASLSLFLNFVMVLSVHVCNVIQNDVKTNNIHHNFGTFTTIATFEF